MNKEQRQIYVDLAGELNWSMCAFCKYSVCYGNICDGFCDDGECEHPLVEVVGFGDDYLEPYTDCWGFRPSHDVALCADIVGICLQNGWSFANWWESKGKVLIRGEQA